MWLEGFNYSDSTPQFRCQKVTCPHSYLPEELAVDFDRDAPNLGPYGHTDVQNQSTISRGRCPIDSAYFSDMQMRELGASYIDSFDKHV